MRPIIELKDIGLQYKTKGNIFNKNKYHDALKNINLKVYPGETIGIIGKNGSGKSSLLKIMSGIIQPTSGEVINRGSSTSLLTIGAGFDNNLSGQDNTILNGMLQGLSSKEIKEKADEIHSYSGLEDFFFEPVRSYSSGMRSRLGFSISIHLNCELLLIDEILSVGDQEFKEKSELAIAKRVKSNQTTVIVSHSLALLNKFKARIIEIK